jgi:hypothetical protein
MWKGLEHFGGVGAYNRREIFTVRGITKRIEVLEVDITGRRLVPVRSLGRHATFLGWTHCVLISTETFPSIAADAVYLDIIHQQHYQGFNIYHINSKRSNRRTDSLFVWLMADGWCWFVLREKYCWLVAGGWFVMREKYYWLVADKPSEQGANHRTSSATIMFKVFPAARPCNFDQYLASYVDRFHGKSGPCINHANHNIFWRSRCLSL